MPSLRKLKVQVARKLRLHRRLRLMLINKWSLSQKIMKSWLCIRLEKALSRGSKRPEMPSNTCSQNQRNRLQTRRTRQRLYQTKKLRTVIGESLLLESQVFTSRSRRRLQRCTSLATAKKFRMINSTRSCLWLRMIQSWAKALVKSFLSQSSLVSRMPSSSILRRSHNWRMCCTCTSLSTWWRASCPRLHHRHLESLKNESRKLSKFLKSSSFGLKKKKTSSRQTSKSCLTCPTALRSTRSLWDANDASRKNNASSASYAW